MSECSPNKKFKTFVVTFVSMIVCVLRIFLIFSPFFACMYTSIENFAKYRFPLGDYCIPKENKLLFIIRSSHHIVIFQLHPTYVIQQRKDISRDRLYSLIITLM